MEENNFSQNDDIKSLLAENLKLMKETHEMVHRINRHITFQKIMSVVYFLLIVVPLIVGAVYLPTIMKSFLSPYQELLNNGQNSGNELDYSNPSGIGNILKQAQEILDKNKNNK